MRRPAIPLLALAALAVVAATAGAHDLFLKPTRFVVPPNATARVAVLNGTFTTSENAVARDRVADLSLAGPGGRRRLGLAAWRETGNRSVVAVPVGAAGTWMLGASLRPRALALDSAQFTGYLREEGLDDVLAERARAGLAGKPVRERYAKHVKTLLRAGAVGGDGGRAWAEPFGYPAELVPLADPYTLTRGDSLPVRALVDGRPAAGMTVLSGGRTRADRGASRIRVQRARTDADGRAWVRLTRRGLWYVKFIHMAPVRGDSVDYESKWATLTFQVR